MRGIHIFEKPYYREIRTMRGRPMRGSPVFVLQQILFLFSKHLDTMSKVTDCETGQTDICPLLFPQKINVDTVGGLFIGNA